MDGDKKEESRGREEKSWGLMYHSVRGARSWRSNASLST